ncbi:ATP-binding cassette sub-family B member 10, mitochondrial-like [Trichogramma pretiosum]|uniref:ATP-binding cassette sub-family B member 10, mitochondrial-like n=1 Tax=Trichogramma pretiosum TaxID=7493 RepID=UPI0006C94A4E|nr:ATP-binding cassette sub-family B member 10, mitochondrial-like [Trichogramma pretiosum]
MLLFGRFLRAGTILHTRPRNLGPVLPTKCYVQIFIAQSSQLSRKKILNLKHIKRFSSNNIKTKIISPAKQTKFVNKKSINEFRRLFLLAKPEKWRLLGAIVFLVISSTVTMAVPFCLGKIIDIIYTNDHTKTKENLNNVCLILLGVFIFGGLCNFARVYLMTTTGHKITQALRKKAYGAILSQETAMFDKVSTGELVGRLSGDAQLVSSAITSNISDGLRSGIMTTAGISMMFYVSPQLALVGLAIVPPVAGMGILYGRFVRKISKDVQNSLAVLNTTAEEKISNIRTVKAFAQEKNEIEIYRRKLKHLLDLCYKESFYRGVFFGMTGLSGNAIILSVLYYGGAMLSDATISVGNLSAFLLYAAYVGISMGGLSSFYSELNKALGASTRLFELIDRRPSIPIEGGKVIDSGLSGEIIFDKINFTYPTRNDTMILQDFTLSVPKNSITAVVGASGSGKSTLAALLLRLYDPCSGSVLLDGEDLRSLDPYWVKGQMGFVSQEPILFNGSIRENIVYGSDEASEADILQAAKQANVLEFVEKMPDGLDTYVGERGITLSGGQRQRVAIARALIKNPKILILDEATSALDATSEKLVQEALERATKGRTTLTIAHRLSTIRNADKIAVLDAGKISESGSYDELMCIENGLFRKLVQHQTFG